MRLFASLVAALLLLPACDGGTDQPPGAPATARILAVSVQDFPFRDYDVDTGDPVNGSAWDGGNDNADVYFAIYDGEFEYREDADLDLDRINALDDGSVSALRSDRDYFVDPTSVDLPLQWEIEPGLLIRDLDDELYVALFDRDTGGRGNDDPMSSTETFVLADVAPQIVTGRTQTVVLDGFTRSRNDEETRIIVTVLFED